MKWFTYPVGGQAWTHHRVKPGTKYLAKGEKGVITFEKSLIHLSSELEGPALDEVLLHEWMHAAFYVSGAAAKLVEVLGETSAHSLEEEIVGRVTPLLHRIMVDHGAAFPKAFK